MAAYAANIQIANEVRGSLKGPFAPEGQFVVQKGYAYDTQVEFLCDSSGPRVQVIRAPEDQTVKWAAIHAEVTSTRAGPLVAVGIVGLLMLVVNQLLVQNHAPVAASIPPFGIFLAVALWATIFLWRNQARDRRALHDMLGERWKYVDPNEVLARPLTPEYPFPLGSKYVLLPPDVMQF